ncbi:hypothetical protein E2C01_076600 [Portunus trituberculatus]|uniref:Uncharacterized protein n=1 Tax=Portunus trituberculatus TaxID=210409 RepID=A0A5B7IJ62_PORTR|nr:hypothetical protein [Portunus trituberculatus]
MWCNNLITQCIPLHHRSVRKTVSCNILHTLPHPDLLYMSSCPSIPSSYVRSFSSMCVCVCVCVRLYERERASFNLTSPHFTQHNTTQH